MAAADDLADRSYRDGSTVAGEFASVVPVK
jgi:hypothetical protein